MPLSSRSTPETSARYPAGHKRRLLGPREVLLGLENLALDGHLPPQVGQARTRLDRLGLQALVNVLQFLPQPVLLLAAVGRERGRRGAFLGGDEFGDEADVFQGAVEVCAAGVRGHRHQRHVPVCGHRHQHDVGGEARPDLLQALGRQAADRKMHERRLADPVQRKVEALVRLDAVQQAGDRGQTLLEVLPRLEQLVDAGLDRMQEVLR